jgi:cell division protein FtsB
MPRGSSLFNNLLKKYLKKIFLCLIILGILYYLFFGTYGFISIFKLKRKESSLRKTKQELLTREKALSDSLKKIKTDTFLIEKIAREKLGMIKSGDTVILYDEK